MSTHADGVAQEATPTSNAAQAKAGDKVAEMWQRFDKKAEQHIKELVESLNQQLENLLLFAALFSTINTALLIYTLPTLSPSPQDQTNALLYLLVQGLNSSTLSALGDAATTNPSHLTSMVRVNALFTASLTCSLLASFGAVIGKQWLTYYSRSLYSSSEERRRELQRKIMGADRWHLRGILEAGLSSVLQVALLLFAVGLVIFLQTINHTIAILNTAITALWFAALVLSLPIALWDDSCPYQSPLTMSIIPGFFHFMVWLKIVTVHSVILLFTLAWKLLVIVYLAARGRFSEVRRLSLNFWARIVSDYGPPGGLYWTANLRYREIRQSLKRNFGDWELDAASLAWLVLNTRDTAEFNSIVEVIPLINERKTLNLFVNNDASDRLEPCVQSQECVNSELAALMAPRAHTWVADPDISWPSYLVRRLVMYRPAVGSPEESTGSDVTPGQKFSIPAPLYIAAALRSILDHRIYYKWKYDPTYHDANMDRLDSKLRLIITSCANPSAPPRVVSMITLALKITTGRVFREATPHKELRQSQKADYDAVWSSYTSDEPFVKNLAGGVLLYAERRKTPPQEAAWPSGSQLRDILLASRSYIEMKASAKQLELDGPDLIRGCASLLGSFAGPSEDVQDGDVVEAARELITTTIERAIALGDLSTELLATEVEMLNALGQLYQSHRSAPILDSFYCLLEHCQSQLIDKPIHPPRMASRQSSLVIAAAGHVLETLVGEEVGSAALATKVTNLIEKIVDKALIDWEDEGTSTTWASNPTMLAMVQYFKHLLDRGDVGASRREFAVAYATTVNNSRWHNLSDEMTRLELRGVLGRLQELVDPEKASLAADEAEIIPQAESTYLA